MRYSVQTPQELRESISSEEHRYRHDANIVDGIVLPKDVSGLVATRQWRLQPRMYIASVVHRRRYGSSVIWADKIPTAANSHGIYAWRLPVIEGLLRGYNAGTLTGMVELSGQVVVHEDGILRAECCRILMLIAHPDFAVRLSRIYGTPVMAADCRDEVTQKVISWLYTRDAAMYLKWNADLVADMQAKRLLDQVEGLDGGGRGAHRAEEVPEALKDRGELVHEETQRRPRCRHYYTLIVRNAALQQRLPGGERAFTTKFRCVSNAEISVLQEVAPNLLNRPLAEMLVSGLCDQEDYVLIEPVCLGSSPTHKADDGIQGETSLKVNWLRTETDWLNANTNGYYRWQRHKRQGSSTAH